MLFQGTREWVYPQSIKGAFSTLRRSTFGALHLILFVVPWIQVGSHPLLQIDIPARRLYLLGAIYTASDTVLLLLFLLILAFSLFFFTAIFGRVWCGYACPQTVFLETWIRPLEIWIEGDRVQRKRRDGKEISFDLVWRKIVKWIAFAAVAAFLSMALVSLFAGARNLWSGQAGSAAYGLVTVVSLVWFLDFVWFREQFCSYLCPYARFQSALADDESLIITYDLDRGEPRAKGRASALAGTCIDCNKCVAVCPQGIDIRDGFQLECIQCARCIDACVSVMTPLTHETLISYGSVAETAGRKVRRWRPRTFVYAGLLVSLFVAMITVAATRTPFEATINRVPGTLFTEDADGYIRNTFILRLTNTHPGADPILFEISLDGLADSELLAQPFELESNQTRTVPVIIRIPADGDLLRTTEIEITVTSTTGELILLTTFKTGANLGSQ